MVGYLGLLLVFLALFAFTLYFGLREWLLPEDNTPIPVDVEYIRVENYFGNSFRSKMEEWLQTAQRVEPPEPLQPPRKSLLEKPNHEKILVVSDGLLGGAEAVDELIYGEGALHVPDHSVFNREIYCLGDLESGEGAEFQAVAADGRVTLGANTVVSRWVDGQRKVLLRRGTLVNSRVCSVDSIELEPDVTVQSLYAPLVFTTGYTHGAIADIISGTKDTETSLRVEAGTADPKQVPHYLKGIPCSQLAVDTWLVRGDLKLPASTQVGVNLSVHGNLSTGPGCQFLGNVKANRIELGIRNWVSGNLISAKDITLDPSCWVGKSVVAETDILLRSGVRVGKPNALAVVSAGREVKIEGNVGIYGKIAAGRAVFAL